MKTKKRNFFNKTYANDLAVCFFLTIAFYLVFSVDRIDLDYFDTHRIGWFLNKGITYAIPMSLIMWVTLTKLNSHILFFILALEVWFFFPMFSQIFRYPSSSNFNYNIGGKAIYLNSDLTYYGYYYKLHSPYLFLVLYAAVLLVLELYRRSKNKIIEIKVSE